MLTLPIKRKWFDMICKCQKREEYRELTDYWQVRFDNAMREYPGCHGQVFKVFPVQIRAGYRADNPTAKIWVHCICGKGGAQEWGADPEKNYFVLQILHVETIDNWEWRDEK
uniref:Uncharacterized protein n=1 Tax=Myoviridae sp. ctncN39 TaxID=2825170 RepID=A0A8S5V270_9CAUD|nr:MAG TPA: hypothetical protein [Myoviridae sp. ctncN39]